MTEKEAEKALPRFAKEAFKMIGKHKQCLLRFADATKSSRMQNSLLLSRGSSLPNAST